MGGNWKCNNTLEQSKAIMSRIAEAPFDEAKVDVVVAPVSVHIPAVQLLSRPGLHVAAQNCSATSFGAFTGEVTAEHLKDLQVEWVIIGHSERRTLFHEDDAEAVKKALRALSLGLKVIFCFGESLAHRDSGATIPTIQAQLDALTEAVKDASHWAQVVLAYEPVWAIGTGRTATEEQVKQVHEWIRNYLLGKLGADSAARMRIIYGGSVNGKNCQALSSVPSVDGFLVGGASLKEEFLQIVQAVQNK